MANGIHYRGFGIDNEGNVKPEEDFISEAHICAKCRHPLSKDDMTDAERKEVKTGRAAGRPMLVVHCSNCGQKNIFVLPPNAA